ncbi:serine/threonine protein phosphatase [Paenibacillus rhizovicinus]|uniref:Serine/threonine protein phosphatase n=1 Tax=Paenibacillus rhizovicinus TaxID=2704463 RepID=A0A6C0P8A2_9BACL|nr:metallophosphoesterase [Paenibacillus rhizovicinus]QHW32742.1 serine/threonine protein phosphatase [Paenibacillus rhizovicinus]
MTEIARTLVISDIHGCYQEFVELLELAEFDSRRDRLILLGDYVSRGPSSKEVVELVMSLVQEHGAIALQGNHDHRFVRVIENLASENEIEKFFKFGGFETLHSYGQHDMNAGPENLVEIRGYMERYSPHIQFLKGLPYYYEDDDYIYVHAGLNPRYRQLADQDVHDMLYIKEEFYMNQTNREKVVVFGHTLATDIHGVPEVWLGGDKIGIDGGCAFGYQLNGLALKMGKVSTSFAIRSKVGSIHS